MTAHDPLIHRSRSGPHRSAASAQRELADRASKTTSKALGPPPDDDRLPRAPDLESFRSLLGTALTTIVFRDPAPVEPRANLQILKDGGPL